MTLHCSISYSIWCLFKVALEIHLSKILVKYGKMKKEILRDILYYTSKLNYFII